MPSVSPPPPLEVEFSGCSAVVEGPVCELPEDDALRIWVRTAEGARIALTVDGREVASEIEPVQEGSLIRVRVDSSARELTVTASRSGASALFRLPLRPPSTLPVVQHAETLRKKGELDDAADLLVEPASAADLRTRAAAIGTLARIWIAQGDVCTSLEQLEAAAAMNRSAGRISDALRDELALAYNLIHNGRRFDDARRAIGRARELTASFAEGRPRLLYYEGLLAYETGDYRTALRFLREAARGNERLALDSYIAVALPIEALVLQLLGRDAEGEALLERAAGTAAATSDPCARADLMTNIGWFSLQAETGERGPAARAARAAAALNEALRLYGASGACPRPAEHANVLTNLALLASHDGRWTDAQHHLEDARREAPDPDASLEVWWLDLQGTLARAQGDPRAALDAHDRAADRASLAHLPVARWRASLGRAQALEALGRDVEARAAYEEAEALLQDRSLLVPIDEGRATFLSHFEESARLLVDFLLRRDPLAAASAARRARARSLATLQWIDRLGSLTPVERSRWDKEMSEYRRERIALDDEARDAWKRSAAERSEAAAHRREREARMMESLDRALTALGHVDTRAAADAASAAPASGELLLVYHPIRRGWAGFAVTAGGAAGRDLGPVSAGESPSELARKLLGPFREEIHAAQRIRLLPAGELAAIDVHALPWEGAPLLASRPIAYGVDLPRTTPVTPPGDGALRRALLVVDPRQDLPAARLEGAAVSEALERQGGFRVDWLAGEQATHAALRRALEEGSYDLLHYAGHGVFGGLEGWWSGLSLADKGSLTVSDILTLPRAPREVVLSGCETARSSSGSPVEGMGLARAFLVGGATAVVAAVRPVEDRLAARLMEAFFAAPPGAPGLSSDAPDRLRAAELTVLREMPSSDWASFRVLVP